MGPKTLKLRTRSMLGIGKMSELVEECQYGLEVGCGVGDTLVLRSLKLLGFA